MNINNLNKKDLHRLAGDLDLKLKTPRERLIKHIEKLNYISYPDNSAKDFYNVLLNKKENYQTRYTSEMFESKDGEDIQEKLCPSKDKKFKLLNHQIFLKNYINIKTPYNSVLIFHGLGSGKTCSAISIAETYKNNITNNLSSKILVLVSGATIENNFRNEIHDIKKGYNQCTFSDYIVYKPYDNNSIKQKKVDDLIDTYYDIFHYQKFTNIVNNKYSSLNQEKYREWIRRNYSNRVFIIDEVHNLKDKGDVKDILKRYDVVMDIVKYAVNIKLVLLSGTPMSHSPREYAGILNLMLVNDNHDPIDVDDFFDGHSLIKDKINELKHLSRGYISFIRKENPMTFASKSYSGEYIDEFINKKFGSLVDKVEREQEYKIVPCVMKGDQKDHYLSYVKDEKINSTELIQLGLISYDVNNKKEIHKLPFKSFDESVLENISAKYAQLIKNIKKSPKSPIFIYSNFKDRGVLMIISALLKNGVDMSRKVRNEDSLVFGRRVFLDRRIRPTRPLCYHCCKKVCTEEDGHTYAPMTFEYIIGETPEDVQAKIIKTFNSPDNKDGKKIKILIGSSVLKEGVSLLNTREAHIMEPWHNLSRLRQVIGRILRHCSHKLLKPNERKVKIYQYASVLEEKYEGRVDINKLKSLVEFKDDEDEMPVGVVKYDNGKLPLLSYDVAVYKRAIILDKEAKVVENLLKKVSVDCFLHKALNIDTLDKDEQYECDFIDYEKKIGENLDTSTYSDMFLKPYIDYVITMIKEMFKKKIIMTIGNVKDLKELQDEIYTENDHYIIKRALKQVIPSGDDFTTFRHIFKGGFNNKYGYIFFRKNEKQSIYIFQDLDGEEKVRSKFENIPIYERNRDVEEKSSSLVFFLKSLQRQDKTGKGTNLYLESLDKTIIDNKVVVVAEKTGNIAMVEIKRLDPIKNHKNDGKYVGIEINQDIFSGQMWLRKTEDNVNKQNKKQYNYGKQCTSYTRIELTEIVADVWSEIMRLKERNKAFIDKNKSLIEAIKNNKERKKEIKCTILRKMLVILNEQTQKTWVKVL